MADEVTYLELSKSAGSHERCVLAGGFGRADDDIRRRRQDGP